MLTKQMSVASSFIQRMHSVGKSIRKRFRTASGAKASVRDIFRKLDKHSYGYITTADLLASAEMHDAGLDSELKEQLLQLAASADGKVTYEAFFQAFFSEVVKIPHAHTNQLRHVLIITRHGARFPLKAFESSVSWPQSSTFWEVYGGKLTVMGQQQLVKLGQGLRKKFIVQDGLLHEDDPKLPRQMYVYTSNTDRTLMSAQGLLLGMLPSVAQSFKHDLEVDHEETSDFKGQTVNIHIANLDQEYTPLLHGFKQNARYEKLRAAAFDNCEWFEAQGRKLEWQTLLEKLWVMTGFKKMDPKISTADRIKHFQSLAQQIGIERAHNMQIFNSTKGLYLEPSDEAKVRESADRCCRLRYQGNGDEDQIEMARLASGVLPVEVVNKLRSVVQGTSELRFSLFSAHDNTIMALLAHLGFRNWEIPQFAAYVAFELHQKDDEWYVQMYYNHDPQKYPPENCPTEDSGTVPMLKVVPKGTVVDYADATRGEMSWPEFENLIMEDRASYPNVEAWKADGQVSGAEALGYELKEAQSELEKTNKKLEKLEKQRAKAARLAEKVAELEEKVAAEGGNREELCAEFARRPTTTLFL